MKLRIAVAAWLLASLAGCEDLSDYDTAAGEAYCGNITVASTFRTGFTPSVQMRLSFDTSKVESGESPGALSTYDAKDETPQMFVEAPLRPIGSLVHDPLSQLSFGDGRDKNMIYAVSPNDPTAESLIAVVSLRSDEGIEVRLVRGGSGVQDAAPGRRQLFGLFVLARQEGDCGF
jgi:hypothetical protein